MKKIKILSLLLALSLILCGCGGKNSNIKLSSINIPVSDFYHQSVMEILEVSGLGETMLLQSEDSEAGKIYEGLTYSVQQCEMYYYIVTSALDFCIDVAENQSEETQKFFEYTSSQWSGQTIVVVVDKQKGKSVYQTKMYYIYGDNVNYSNIVNNEDAIIMWKKL